MIETKETMLLLKKITRGCMCCAVHITEFPACIGATLGLTVRNNRGRGNSWHLIISHLLSWIFVESVRRGGWIR